MRSRLHRLVTLIIMVAMPSILASCARVPVPGPDTGVSPSGYHEAPDRHPERVEAQVEARLREVLAAPALPELTRRRTEEVLARAEAASRWLSYGGSATIAGRFETNATALPLPSLVRVRGRLGELDRETTGRADYSGVAIGALRLTHDPGRPGGATVEANLLGYGSRHGRSEKIDLNLIDLDVGPRLHLADGLLGGSGVSVRPHLSATLLDLGDDRYLRAVGGGLAVRRFLGEDLLAELGAEVIAQDYDATGLRPAADDRSGMLWTLGGGLSWQLDPATLLFGRLGGAVNEARRDWFSYREAEAAAGLLRSHAAPFGPAGRPWRTTLSAGVRRTWYEATDPSGIRAGGSRWGTRWDLALATAVPLTGSLSLLATVQRTLYPSSAAAGDVANTSAAVGIQWRF